ncbi:MBL fold metallo-hydrolase [Streptomyces albiaxialis]|uniref:MBL fold metallo-hydrolase n=1 Tax=Streptomyces albiaxialis TaxID=329523 RepID=A0ABP5HNI1_9ACTN
MTDAPEAVQDAASDAPFRREVAPGVHAYVQPHGGWCLNNAGWVTDGTTTLLVDTAATERRTLALREALLASGAPLPRLVVNTHHHGDHTYGNALFTAEPPGATVIGHASCRAGVLSAGRQLHALWPDVDFGEIVITPPTLTYEGELTLHVGGTEGRLFHPGVSHTTGDTVVWLPERGVVFTGDLIFHGGTPFVLMGSLTGSLRTLDRLRALGAHTVVPGHGPPAGPEVYDEVERYLRYVDGLARDAHSRGLSALEAAREADLGDFAALPERERLVANLRRALAERAGAPEGTPVDVPAAFADMAEMNGGAPVPCPAAVGP